MPKRETVSQIIYCALISLALALVFFEVIK